MLNAEIAILFNSFDAQAWLFLLREHASSVVEWIENKYVAAPALMLSLGVALALPAIAAVAAIVRSLNHKSLHKQTRPSRTIRPQAASAWRQHAWLELIGDRAPNYHIEQGIVRIGRESDNDLCISDPAVHRYHAVLEQTPEAEYIISYVGAPEYDGLLVDGNAIQHQHLRGGEVLELGATKLRFAISPA